MHLGRRATVCIVGSMHLALVTVLALAPAARPNVLDLVEQLRESESWRTRMEAAVGLGRSDDIRARVPLERALADPHYAVRSAAIRALVHLGDIRSLPAVLDLCADDEPFVRSEAQRQVGRFDADDARPYLIHALDRHEEPRVRLAAATWLAAEPTKEAFESLLDAMGQPGEVGRFATSVITAQPEPEAIGLLLSGLKRADYRVQIASIQGLAELDAAAATEPIITMLDSRVPEVTLAAADALQILSTHIDEKKHFVAARRSKNRFRRARALKVVGVLGGEEASTLLLTSMNDQDVLIRGAAVHGLSLIGETRAIPKLREMKKHQENARIIGLVRSTLAYLERIRDEGAPRRDSTAP
jgi:HEAT repeat protein